MILYFKKKPAILSCSIGTKFFLILLSGLLTSLFSCDKSSVVGLDVQPTNDLLNVGNTDTLTLITKTIRVDSLETDQTIISSGKVLLGKYVDPIFGTSTASFYTQVRLSTSIGATSFGLNPICDSIVLALSYSSETSYDAASYYGKKNRVAQNVNVYQVVEDIKLESHYSNDVLKTSTFDLASNHSFVPQPNTNVTIDGVVLNPQLRISLDKTFGQILLNSQSSGNLATNDVFYNYMKGLYITTENSTINSGEGNILYFLMGDPQSKMTIYYHESGNNSLKYSQKYDFGLSSVTRFNHFSHDYSSINSNLSAQIGTTPPAQNDLVFVQSMAGLKTKIEMPTLMNLVKNNQISINKAELIIKADLTTTYMLDTFAAANSLIVFGINDDSTSYVIPDYYLPSSAYFDGNYNSTIHEYHINMASYIQQVLIGKRKNNGLYLLAAGGAIYGNRVVIGGGGNGSPYQMKLNITYTKLH